MLSNLEKEFNQVLYHLIELFRKVGECFLLWIGFWSKFYLPGSLVLDSRSSSEPGRPASSPSVRHWHKCSVCWPCCGVFVPLQVCAPTGGETENLNTCPCASSSCRLLLTKFHPDHVWSTGQGKVTSAAPHDFALRRKKAGKPGDEARLYPRTQTKVKHGTFIEAAIDYHHKDGYLTVLLYMYVALHLFRLQPCNLCYKQLSRISAINILKWKKRGEKCTSKDCEEQS